MSLIYILNESSELDIPGDVTFYDSLDGVLGYVEAIDIRNNEYFLLSSDGRKAEMIANDDYGPIKIKFSSQPLYQNELIRLLKMIIKTNNTRLFDDVLPCWESLPLPDLFTLVCERVGTYERHERRRQEERALVRHKRRDRMRHFFQSLAFWKKG